MVIQSEAGQKTQGKVELEESDGGNKGENAQSQVGECVCRGAHLSALISIKDCIPFTAT